MLSIDTNILLVAHNSDCPENAAARAFLSECARRDDVVLCELVLLELYQLLRSPAVTPYPLDAADAAEICRAYRYNPRWTLVENAPVMDKVWALAARPGIARRQLFDARLAFTLLHHGVDELATHNTHDFHDFDFHRVWNPLSD